MPDLPSCLIYGFRGTPFKHSTATFLPDITVGADARSTQTTLTGAAFVDGVFHDFGPAYIIPAPRHEWREDSAALPKAIEENWYALSEAGFSEALRGRLVCLAGLGAGWRGVNSLPMHSKSLDNFLNFWRDVRADSRAPEIVLCPNGNIQAEWYQSASKNVFIEFTVENRLACFILTDAKKEISGLDDIENLTAFLLSRKNNPLA